MRKHIRFFALLLCVLLLASLFSSYIFMGVFAGHLCSHNHCRICEHAALLSRVLLGVLLLCAAAFASRNLLRKHLRSVLAGLASLFDLTPVACKVRLNN